MELEEKKNAATYKSEINPLIFSHSKTDREPAVTVSESEIPRHGFPAEPPQFVEFRRTRKPLSRSTIVMTILDLFYIIGPILFVVFGCLVYIHREEPIVLPRNSRLLTAARYVSAVSQIILLQY